MESLGTWLVVIVCLFLSSVFSGSETGIYSLSRTRLDLEASEGSWRARLVRRLVQKDASILITILIGNNLVLEIVTLRVEAELGARGVGEHVRELVLVFLLAPAVFLFGEVLPKDLFRLRPHGLMTLVAPILAAARILFWPLERILRGITALLERVFGLGREELARGRARVYRLIDEGARTGALEPQAERLARNALALRGIPVERAMVPWDEVLVLRRGDPEAELRRAVERSIHTRLPVVEGDGSVTSYVHQLDALAAGPEVAVLSHARPILNLTPTTPVDRALARLRTSGQRAAIVGEPQAPRGLVTLKDLVEEISGDLGTW